jgi:hypothetical protein
MYSDAHCVIRLEVMLQKKTELRGMLLKMLEPDHLILAKKSPMTA